jgi:hypothetical protein
MSDLSLDRSTAGAAARLRHWSKPEDALVPVSEVGELSDEQRSAILAWFSENPDGGLKAALKTIGIRATKDEARALLLADDELRDTRFRAMGLDEVSLIRRIGEIASDHAHKDTFRATMAGLNMFHGWRESTESVVDVSHSGVVTVEHERRLTIGDVIDARHLTGSGGGAGGELPAAREVLPAPVDG